MDDQNNKSNQGFGFGTDSDHNHKDEMNPSSGFNKEDRSTADTNTPYYYSYGPYQSQDRNREEQSSGGYDSSSYEARNQEDVEITPPQPVRQVPTGSYPARSTFEGASNGGNSDSGGPGGRNQPNWQYSHKKPKSPIKSVVAGVLAGMVLMGGAMYYADSENLFTGGKQALSDAPAAAAASNAVTDSAATNVKLPVSSGGDVTSVVKQAGPAVVQIETLVKANKNNGGGNSFNNDPFFNYFFGDPFGGGSGNGGSGGSGGSGNGSNGTDDGLVASGLGSGFFFDKSGYILTNEHVVHGADVVQVTVQGTTKPYEAKVLGTSYDLDLAVLKIDGDGNFPSISLADSSKEEVGESVVAIGNPQGFDHTVTAGVLSATGREISIAGENGEKDRKYQNLLQTDASINPGNSGGPLLNLNGEVIGINVAVSSDSQGIGFAIPTSTITEVLDKLKNNEEIPATPEPFIGASLQTVTPQVAKQMGTNVTEGSLVMEVLYKSPAYQADLRPYDIISGADGTNYGTADDLIAYIQKKKVGDKITLNIVRDGKKIDLPVTIGNKNDFQTSTSGTTNP
ncbi:serine protease [Paenibacillus yonginensis]|uniref:Serine protease n=1 Tax=Paenibacillus yonginensis TaxID=1462996 RepID=A0A1B1MWW5_9BACL|nr:trypsin-like peptidase domain-containing protein [Paenibacillus yonginensis]ANS73658.1 serine protease [Paenibacillus yonginensis]